MQLKLPIFISLFSKNRASFTYHRSSSQKIRSTRVRDIETLTQFQSNKISGVEEELLGLTYSLFLHIFQDLFIIHF